MKRSEIRVGDEVRWTTTTADPAGGVVVWAFDPAWPSSSAAQARDLIVGIPAARVRFGYRADGQIALSKTIPALLKPSRGLIVEVKRFTKGIGRPSEALSSHYYAPYRSAVAYVRRDGGAWQPVGKG